MRNGAVARHAVGRLDRIGLEPGDQLLEVRGADRRAHGDTNSKRASSETGMKSFTGSKLGWFSTIGNRYMVGPVVTRMVVPSGLAPFTDLMPISPSPPVRFSTMKLRSSSGGRYCASCRHSMSPLPPAANGKTIRVSGPDWARAAPIGAAAEKTRPPATKSRRFMSKPLPAILTITTDRSSLRNSHLQRTPLAKRRRLLQNSGSFAGFRCSP